MLHLTKLPCGHTTGLYERAVNCTVTSDVTIGVDGEITNSDVIAEDGEFDGYYCLKCGEQLRHEPDEYNPHGRPVDMDELVDYLDSLQEKNNEQSN